MLKCGPVRVAVTGACGRMGREVVRAVHEADGLELAAAVDRSQVGEDAGKVCGLGKLGIPVRDDLSPALRESRANVMVDFTVPASAWRISGPHLPPEFRLLSERRG
jgi:Dihydrodipicolinate reductase